MCLAVLVIVLHVLHVGEGRVGDEVVPLAAWVVNSLVSTDGEYVRFAILRRMFRFSVSRFFAKMCLHVVGFALLFCRHLSYSAHLRETSV